MKPMNPDRSRRSARTFGTPSPATFAFVCLAVILATAPSAVAQVTSAKINGTVGETSRAAIREAQITVTNVETHVNRKTTSSADGSYVVPLLPPGNYQISVKKEGFQPLVRSAITLEVD